MITYWSQIDVEFSGNRSRFFMLDCEGKDQVVRAEMCVKKKNVHGSGEDG